MPKLKIKKCVVNQGQLQYEYMFDINVNGSDQFSKVKIKIQETLKEVPELLKNNEIDQVFYVCEGKVLIGNDQMKEFQLKDQPDIIMYESEGQQLLLNKYNEYLQNQGQQQQQQQQQQYQQQQEIETFQKTSYAQLENERLIQQQQEQIKQLSSQIQEIDKYKERIQQAQELRTAQLDLYKQKSEELTKQKRSYETLQKQFDKQNYDFEMVRKEKEILNEHLNRLMQNLNQ